MKPQVFGRYLLLDRVASGGMAEVWRGKLSGEQGFSRIYAIKKILPHVAEDQDFIAMFTDEAVLTASLQHANIGQVFEFSKVDETYYIAMEYVSGKDLKSIWNHCRGRKTLMPLDLVAHVVGKMAEGLDYAHRRTDNFGKDAGIVHRDVSPQNVLLSWDGEVKVIDFGIAKASEKSGRTRPGTLKGKFAYMAPEQIRGMPLDGRSDVFALGVCLYELATGERGFAAESEFSLLEMVRNVEIKPPTLVNQNLPADMERIIYKALAKDREHRYQTGMELTEDLQRYLLAQGRPPGRTELAKYLRENFTVEFEKERARLESYKELTAKDAEDTNPKQRPAASSTAEADEDDDGESAFAATEPQRLTRPARTYRAPSHSGEANEPAATTPSQVNKAPAPSQRSALVPAFAAAMGTLLVLSGLWFAKATWFAFKGTVVVTVTGALAATVRFDDRPQVRAEPSFTIDQVRTGRHTLVVEEPGFASFSTTIEMNEQNPLIQIKAPLRRHPGRLKLVSEPAGAHVMLDGKDTGLVTPTAVEIEGDTPHDVSITLDGFRPMHKSDLKVPPTQEATERFALTPTRLRITIDSQPSGASLSVNGSPVGTAPISFDKNPEDTAYPKVSATLKGCEPKESTIPFDAQKANQTFVLVMKCRAP